MLKGVIFSLRDVLAKAGPIDADRLGETVKLLRYLKSRGVEPVFISNRGWTITSADGSPSKTFKELLEAELGPISYYIGGQDGMPYKPLAAATAYILADKGWTNREVIYVGNTESDMRTAQNGNILFVNVLWHGEASPYGFQFESPRDVARFVDCVCLGLSSWFWKIEDGPLRVYAMAPFSTLSSQYLQAHAYSASAKATSKAGAGDAAFWGRLLAARVYFSGLVDEISYITAYPGHAPNSKPTVIAEALDIFGQSLRARYIPDLLIRHRKATKSQTARAAGGSVGVDNQLSTIMLNPKPLKGLSGEPYKSFPLKKDKTVLLVDDFCTEGNSFEAGRAFCLSWLKTINRDYHALAAPLKLTSPFKPLTLAETPQTKTYGYHAGIVSRAAESILPRCTRAISNGLGRRVFDVLATRNSHRADRLFAPLAFGVTPSRQRLEIRHEAEAFSRVR
jgi:hypothetical protein